VLAPGFMPKRCTALAGVLVLLSAMVRAEEATDPLELSWTAPSECPQSSALHAEVLRLIGGKTRGNGRLSAQGTVVREADDHWTVVLTTSMDGAPGERSIAGPTCQAVCEAAALTLALTLDPDLKVPDAVPEMPDRAPSAAVAGPGRARSRRPHRSETGAAVVRPAWPAPLAKRVTVVGGQVVPVAQSRIHGLARVLGGGNVGVLPKLASEVGLGLGVGRGSAVGWLLGTVSPGQSVGTTTRPDLATVWAGSVTALGCYRLRAHRAEIDPCAGLGLTVASGTGTDRIRAPQTDSLLWVSPTLGVSIGYRLSHALRLSLDGLGLAPLDRPEGQIEGLGRVYKPGRVAGRGSVGLEVQLR
jgi:hypothetical protein